MTTGLPEGWATIRVGDYFHSWGGMTPSTSNASYWGGKVPWVSSKDIKAWRIAGGEDFITQKALQETSLRLCPVGSVLIVVRSGILAHTLPIAVADSQVSINQDLKAFHCPDSGLNEWLALALRALAPEILTNNRKDGTTVQSVRYEELCDLIIPVPPSTEQRRITAQLGNLVEKIESTRGRLSRVPTILKRFRQAVLLAAGSGKLTENWRSTYEPTESARDLYNRAQQLRAEKYASDCEAALSNGRRRPADPRKSERSGKQVVDLPEFPEQWGLYPLQDLTYLVTDGTHRTPTYLDKGTAFLSVKNVRPFRIRDEDIKRISPDEHREINLRCNPATGDILYTKVGATFGYAALNRLQYPFSLFVSVALLKPVQECFVPEYAEIILNSDIVYRQAADRVSGSGTPDLHLIEIRDFRIPLPPLDEQKEIVRCVNRLFELADVIGQRVAKSQERTGRLTQSILAKAFRGDLLPTEAELARREGREYEPASVLLERIKKERNSGTPSKGTRQRTRSNGTLASAKGKA